MCNETFHWFPVDSTRPLLFAMLHFLVTLVPCLNISVTLCTHTHSLEACAYYQTRVFSIFLGHFLRGCTEHLFHQQDLHFPVCIIDIPTVHVYILCFHCINTVIFLTYCHFVYECILIGWFVWVFFLHYLVFHGLPIVYKKTYYI